MIRAAAALLFVAVAALTAGTTITTAQITPAELHDAQAHMAEENYRAATELLQVLAEEPDAAPDVFRMLSSSYILDGQAEESLAAAERGIERYPDDASLYALKVEATRFVNPAEAVALLDQVITDYERGAIVSPHISLSELREFLPDVLLSAGAAMLESEQHPEAVAFLERASELGPDSAQIQHHLFYAYLQTGAFSKLVDTYENLPSGMQQDEMLNSLYTQALIEDEETATLLEIYRERYEEDPKNEQYALFYGQLLLHESRFQEAEMVFYQLLQEQPETREVYQTLLEIYRRQLNYEAISSVLGLKVEQFPDEQSLWEELGEVLEIRGMYEDAEALYERASQRFADSYTFIRRNALMNYYAGEQRRATELLLEAQHDFEQLEEARLDLGMLYYLKENYKKASRKLDEPGDAHADDSFISLIAARSARQTGDIEKAGRHYAQIRSSESPHPEAWLFGMQEEGMSPDENEFLRLFEPLIKRYDELEEEASVYAQFAVRGLPADDPYPFYPFQERAADFIDTLEELMKQSIRMLSSAEAQRLINELQRLYPENALVFRFGGSFYQLRGEPEMALRELEAAADLNTGDSRTYLEIAEIHEQQQDYGQAAMWYERALTAGAGDDIYPVLVRVHRANDTLDELIQRWKIRYSSGQAGAAFRESLIDALHRAGRSEEAREIAREG